MKTRIISGAVMGALLLAILGLGYSVSPMIITVVIALLAAVATFELVHNVTGIKSKTAIIASMLYTAVAVVCYALDGFKIDGYKMTTYHISVIFVLVAVFITLRKHKDFNLASILSLCVMPIVLVYAFGSLEQIANYGTNYKNTFGGIYPEEGIYYLLMMLNFSSICDMGAYFVGVTTGKHKLCPEISPKKTVEGAIGGILTSVVFSLVFNFAFGMTDKLLPTLILTIPLCIVGMCGDLFASTIKRAVGIKDYGNLIPGHGGILDRFDSVIFTAPMVFFLVMLMMQFN